MIMDSHASFVQSDYMIPLKQGLDEPGLDRRAVCWGAHSRGSLWCDPAVPGQAVPAQPPAGTCWLDMLSLCPASPDLPNKGWPWGAQRQQQL